ncbi:MAG TPA: hypothetical protein VGC53_03320 [Vicinamibacteria bacterium]
MSFRARSFTEVNTPRAMTSRSILVLVPKESEKARFELVPFRRAVHFPHGAGKNPMVTRTVRIFHKDYGAVQPGDRQKFDLPRRA